MKKNCNFSFVRTLDNVKKESIIAIYGAGGRGHFLYERIKTHRPDITIACFIDDSIMSSSCGIPVNTYLVAKEKFNWNLILVASIHVKDIIEKLDTIENVLVPSITMIEGVKSNDRVGFIQLIKNSYSILNTYRSFSDSASKELYFQLLMQRVFGFGYADRIYASKVFYAEQYFEYIEPDSISTVLDAGVHDGYTAKQFLSKLKNIKKVYGFDLSESSLANGTNADLLHSDSFDLCLYPLSDLQFSVYILFDKKNPSASKIQKKKIEGGIKSQSTTIDYYSEKNNIKFDLLKFDIEGAESLAIKGAKKILVRDRPQVAISIYHSPDDFINIPYNLIKSLKNYNFYLGHYSLDIYETVFYAIPKELRA
jgi:FkbM family methyltransferase